VKSTDGSGDEDERRASESSSVERAGEDGNSASEVDSAGNGDRHLDVAAGSQGDDDEDELFSTIKLFRLLFVAIGSGGDGEADELLGTTNFLPLLLIQKLSAIVTARPHVTAAKPIRIASQIRVIVKIEKALVHRH
jgi:hypothetical protein